MNSKPQLAALLCVLVVSSTGCGLFNLRYLPVDLFHAAGRGPEVTAPDDPGPVESALHRAARETGQVGLLVDTARPDDDLKRLARRCDQGEDRACEKLGTPLVFFLDERALGITLWERACAAGSARACRVLADFLARASVPEHDPERAAGLYERGCTLEPPDRRACWVAARAHEDSRPDLFFVRVDRACEHGSSDACSALARLGDRYDERLVEYYRWRRPVADLAEAKRALLVLLRAEVFAAQVRRILGDELAQRHTERVLAHCRTLGTREERMGCERLAWHGGHGASPARWTPATEVQPACLACESRCADVGDGPRCFCRCASEAGGCALEGDVLNRCLEKAPDRYAP